MEIIVLPHDIQYRLERTGIVISRINYAFTNDNAGEITEKSASTLVNTKQRYGFGIVNTSDKSVKLLKIELRDYQGIKISDLSIDGKPVTVQDVPSHRVYTSSGSWTTNNQRNEVYYAVEIQEPSIKNPRSVLITYSYMGLNHTQIMKIPILR